MESQNDGQRSRNGAANPRPLLRFWGMVAALALTVPTLVASANAGGAGAPRPERAWGTAGPAAPGHPGRSERPANARVSAPSRRLTVPPSVVARPSAFEARRVSAPSRRLAVPPSVVARPSAFEAGRVSAPSRRLAVPPSAGKRPSGGNADTLVTLYLLGTTDVHGHIYPYDYFTRRSGPGLGLVAALVDSVRRAHPGATYLFDSGDLLQGTPLTFLAARRDTLAAHPVIRAMNLLGYAASAIGNHEYNYGIPALDRALAQARFPFVSANVFRHGTGEPAYRPYVLIPHVLPSGDTIVLGVTGITPPGVLIWDRANVEGRLDFRDPVASLQPVVAEMRARGANLVVVLNHGGLAGSSYDTAGMGVPAENAGARIAREVPGVDVIFLGHTHAELQDSTINGVLITQARAWARSLAQVEVTLHRGVWSGARWAVVARRATLLRPDPAHPDTVLLDSLRWAHERAVAYVGSVIGRAAATMESARSRAEDTPLVDFINEVQRRAAGADLAASPAYSLEARVPAGPVNVGEIAALYPYDNTLEAVRVTGAQLKEYLEKSARYFRTWPVAAGESLIDRSVAGYNFDMVAGVDYTIDLAQPAGARITGLSYRGQPVTPDQTFTLALNNYRQGGGGGYSMVARAPVVYDRQQDIRDLLVDEVRRQGVIQPQAYFHANWRIVPAAAQAEVARELAGGEAVRAAPAGSGAGAAAAPKRLRVLSINDFHGRLLPETVQGFKVGGAATLAAYLEAERAGFDGPSIVLDGGDGMQGTPLSNLTQGRSSVEVMNALGVAAAAIGNHEFDWGPAVLRRRMHDAHYPWISANIVVAGTDTTPSWIRDTATVRVGDVTVGLVGLLTLDARDDIKHEYTRGLDFADGAATIDRWVPILRRQGVDFVILLAHSGGECRALAVNCRGEIVDWARRVHERPDLIVAGHTHNGMQTVVNGIPIVEAMSYSIAYQVVDLKQATTSGGAPASAVGAGMAALPAHAWLRGIRPAFTDSIAPDSAVAALVERYRRQIGRQLDAIVARLAEPLPKGRGDYALGRLLADAWRVRTGARVAFMNNGGIRTSLPAGPLTWGKLYELQPFENHVVVLTVTGARLRAAVEHALRGEGPDANVSGLRATYDPSRPPGARVLTLTLDDGTPVADSGRYTVALQDFVAEGGDGFTAFLEPLALRKTGWLDRDVLTAYLRSLDQPIRAPQEARLVLAPAPSAGTAGGGPAGPTAGGQR